MATNLHFDILMTDLPITFFENFIKDHKNDFNILLYPIQARLFLPFKGPKRGGSLGTPPL